MESQTIEISTKLGKLKGLIKTSAGLSKKTYYSFQGIPYGKPPVGELRFKAPEPFGHWEGVRDATKEGNDTVQLNMFTQLTCGDEDCLYLNVYTPQEPGKTGEKKAVMVWIYGGGFVGGSGSTESFGPDYLIEEDVVLVTINYRCGALGFLSLENEKVPGNAGLKDQNLALRWVQENIHSFGGDATNVTIFGESAGGVSVHYHIMSPLSKGLFHKGIMQSCFGFNPVDLNPKQRALRLAKQLGCTSQDPDLVLDFLRAVPASKIVEVKYDPSLLSEREKLEGWLLNFLPCVEKAGNAPFLPDYPRKLMEKVELNKLPIILGITEKEGLFAVHFKNIPFEKMNKDPSFLVPLDLNIDRDSEECAKLGKEILEFYLKKGSWSQDAIEEYVDYITDTYFGTRLDEARCSLLKQGANPLFTFLFSFTSPPPLTAQTTPQACPDKTQELLASGASHGSELVYLFKPKKTQAPQTPPNPEDEVFIGKFVKAWTTFAKNGDPNCKELGVTWKHDSTEHPSYMDLGKVLKTVDGIALSERTMFWRNIYNKYPPLC